MAAVEEISKNLDRQDVTIHCLWNPDMPARHAGVGLARKIAMDTAVQRFNLIGRKDGIILAFDADSQCEPGYLKKITGFYLSHPSARTANIYFEHPTGGPLDKRIYQSITQYELYLRYMKLAIESTGHPHAIHTVGSSFSLRARTYIRVNGMGRDKAGEDFYFLHKCIQLRNFWEINDTSVYPSSRESDRVSFGTGASIQKQMLAEPVLDVYCLESFAPLKVLFEKVGDFWHQLESGSFNEEDVFTISAGLAEFAGMKIGVARIRDMHRDSASEATFRDKFFAWFNGFMILRYLNEVHKTVYSKLPVAVEASKLADRLGITTGGSAKELLDSYREYEKGRGNRKII